MAEFGKLRYDPYYVIGRGRYGPTVFSGILEDRPVAVKRVPINDVTLRQLEITKEAAKDDHPNILRLIYTEINADFLFLVTEFCRGTLMNYIHNSYEFPKFEGEWQILFQVTKGLAHLHKLAIIHGNIKPSNILIFDPPSLSASQSSKPQIKLADFGIYKAPAVDDFNDQNVETRGWLAPEIYQSNRFHSKMDIFPLGCIFAFTLSGGRHPFGENGDERTIRIRSKEPMLMVEADLKWPYAKNGIASNLINSMVAMNPSKRPSAKVVLNSAFFAVFLVEDRAQPLMEFCISFEIKNIKDYNDTHHQYLKNLLTDAKVNVNVTTSTGETPLHLLCRHYKNDDLLDLIKLLVEKGADLKAKTSSGYTPFLLLCRYHTCKNFNDLINFLLIQNETDINATTFNRETPLHLLCKYYNNDSLIDLVKLLVDKGADLNAKESYGYTPLLLLCRYYKCSNLIDLVNVLMIQNKVDINTRTKDGWTMLHTLCANISNKDNLIDLLKLLQQKGSNFNDATLSKGETPLHLVCQHYQNDNLIDLVVFLMENGAYPNAERKTNHKWTPLHYLCRFYKNDNLIDLIKFILPHNREDVNAKTKYGWAPLHILCANYQQDNLIDIVKLLVKNGADVNITTDNGKFSPLHILGEWYKNENVIDIVNFLIRNGADLNAKTNKGSTPIHYFRSASSTFKNDLLIMDIMTENGVDIHNVESLAPPKILRYRV